MLAKRCRLGTEELAERLIDARRHVPFVQANLIGEVDDDPALVDYWRGYLIANGVWANEPVPLYPYPSSPSYRALWGDPDEHAWERAHDHYLAASSASAISKTKNRAAWPSWKHAAGARPHLARPDDGRRRRRGMALCHDLGRSGRARRRDRVRRPWSSPVARPAQRGRAARDAALARRTSRLDGRLQKLDLDGLAQLGELSEAEKADLLHLNVPSQARGLAAGVPAVVVSHSCVATWWHAVRATALPEDWEWQRQRSLRGFARGRRLWWRQAQPCRACAQLLWRRSADHRGGQCRRGAACGRCTRSRSRLLPAAGGTKARMAALDAAAAASAWPIIVAGALEGPNGERSAFAHAQPVGSVDGDAALIGRAGIVMSPSLYEPFGLAALEAAGAEAALVLSEIPTYRELWEGAALFAGPTTPSTSPSRSTRWRAIRGCGDGSAGAPAGGRNGSRRPCRRKRWPRSMGKRAPPGLRRSRRRGDYALRLLYPLLGLGLEPRQRPFPARGDARADRARARGGRLRAGGAGAGNLSSRTGRRARPLRHRDFPAAAVSHATRRPRSRRRPSTAPMS